MDRLKAGGTSLTIGWFGTRVRLGTSQAAVLQCWDTQKALLVSEISLRNVKSDFAFFNVHHGFTDFSDEERTHLKRATINAI